MAIYERRVRPDSEGAGRTRGAPGNICAYGPLFDPQVVYYSLDGMFNPPRGVRDGGAPLGPSAQLRPATGGVRVLPNLVGEQWLQRGEQIVSISAGGGGYGHPHQRPAQAVFRDAVEGYISPQRARAVYGVALTGNPDKAETLRIDEAATRRCAPARRQPVTPPDGALRCGDHPQSAI